MDEAYEVGAERAMIRSDVMMARDVREAQMPRVVNRLGAASEKLSATVEILEHRLDSVMRPDAASDGPTLVDSIDRGELVQLPRTIFEYVRTVEHTIERLESVLARCEL